MLSSRFVDDADEFVNPAGSRALIAPLVVALTRIVVVLSVTATVVVSVVSSPVSKRSTDEGRLSSGPPLMVA